MGAIVSTKSEISADSISPSAVTAAQAKIRHELLKEHFQYSNPEERAERIETPEEGGADPKWFPAGISPLHQGSLGMPEAEEVQFEGMNWMDSQTVSKRELQSAAAKIRRDYKMREEVKDNRDMEPLPSSSLISPNHYFMIQQSLQDTSVNDTPSSPTPITSQLPLSPHQPLTQKGTDADINIMKVLQPDTVDGILTAEQVPNGNGKSENGRDSEQEVVRMAVENSGNGSDREVVRMIPLPYSRVTGNEKSDSGRGSEWGKDPPSGNGTEDITPLTIEYRPIEGTLNELNKLEICESRGNWEASDSPQQNARRTNTLTVQHLKQNGSRRRKSHEIIRPNKQPLKTVNFNPHFLHSSQPSTPTSLSLHPFLTLQRTRSVSTLSPKSPQASRRGSQSEKQPGKEAEPKPLLLISPHVQSHSSVALELPPPSFERRLSLPPGDQSNQKSEEKSTSGSERSRSALSASKVCRITGYNLNLRHEKDQTVVDTGLVMKGTTCRRASRDEDDSGDKVWSQANSMVDVKVESEIECISIGGEEGKEREEEREEGEGEGEEEEEEREEEKVDVHEKVNAKHVDSLVQLLYSEIAETLEEQKESKTTHPSKVGDVTLLPDVLQKIHTAVVMENMQKRTGEVPPGPPEYGENSILIAPPDNKTLMKAGEFRGEAVSKLNNLTTAIKLDYYRFLSDYDQTFFYAAQQLEAGLKDYTPQTVLLISSTVPKSSALRATVLPNVLVHVYDFHHETPQQLLDKIEEMLEGYKHKAKAKYLGIVCKGGPGHFYLMKNMPVTPAKIRNNVELLEFWQKIGSHMSKLVPRQSIIHLMESNVAGNKQGEQLLTDMEYAMFSHHVMVKSPLELSPSGRTMLGLYFNTAQHKLWKATRYTKLRLFKTKNTEN